MFEEIIKEDKISNLKDGQLEDVDLGNLSNEELVTYYDSYRKLLNWVRGRVRKKWAKRNYPLLLARCREIWEKCEDKGLNVVHLKYLNLYD